MWYFIHIPKCAGRFVQQQLNLAIGHTHSNLKLKELNVDHLGCRVPMSTNPPTNLFFGPHPFEPKEKKDLTFHARGAPEEERFQDHIDTMASRYVSAINPHDGSGLEFAVNAEEAASVEYEPISTENSFAVVRNPFSWLTSYYRHSNDVGVSGWGDANTIHGFGSFKEFATHYCKCLSSRWHSPCLNRSMVFQLFDKDDNLIPKYVIYKERINDGLRACFNHQATSKKKDPKEFPDYDYKKMYDDELIELMNKKFEPELKLFNYDFNGPKDDNVGFVGLRHKYDIFKNKHTFLEQNVVLS